MDPQLCISDLVFGKQNWDYDKLVFDNDENNMIIYDWGCANRTNDLLRQ